MSKQSKYENLVERRKSCRMCNGLVNPAACANGIFDSNHIGPWSRWQGNLHAKLLIVAQDWGNVGSFVDQCGFDTPKSQTNKNLIRLLDSIGVTIDLPSIDRETEGNVFVTNAVLCLKPGGLQDKIHREWLNNCGKKFLKPLIDLVKPKIVVSLGEVAYKAIADAYNLPRMKFRDAVDNQDGFTLKQQTLFFPMYHCGSRMLNTYRKIDQQLADWGRITRVFKP